MKYKGIAEIKAFTSDKEVNKWLARGWELLAVPGNGSTSYIVGRPETPLEAMIRGHKPLMSRL